MRSRLWLALLLLGFALDARAQLPVPSVFQDLNAQLSTDVAAFKNTLDQSWDGTKSDVTFGTNLSFADANRGPALLGPNVADGVRLELDGLKALGVTAVTVQVSFPILYAPFYRNAAEYQRYLDFYVQMARDVRARGLGLIVETQTVFPSYVPSWSLANYYASLTTDQYANARAQMARTIVDNLHPDYISVLHEPDTEAQQTGKADLGTVSGSTALLNTIVTVLRQDPEAATVRIAGGVGTWTPNYADYVTSYAATAIDVVDMHVYPANQDFLARALDIADIATASGKQVGMSEAWLYKVRDTELGAIDFVTIFGRDTFSFWAPLDLQFLQALVELAHLKRFAFMAPYYSGYFHAYLDYDDSTATAPPPMLLQAAATAQAANLRSGTYSSMGRGFAALVLSAPDVTPPAAVTGLSLQLVSATKVAIRWNAATDNVGVAVYGVFRDGTLLTQTAIPSFADPGLAEARTYTYSIVAFDISGNRSSAASATIATPDVTAPSVPSGLSGVAGQSGSQINVSLSWTPASDNVGVTSYRVYQGTSADALRPIAISSGTSYSVSNVPPLATTYFAVVAVDAIGNASAMCAPIAMVIPRIADVAPPNAMITYPPPGTQTGSSATVAAVAWDLPGGAYDVSSGIAGVQFRVDGANVGPEQTAAYMTTPQYLVFLSDLTGLASGSHVLTAVVRDKAGNRTVSAGIPISVRLR